MNHEFLHIDKTFEKINFSNQRLDAREFDGCRFIHCDFSGATFSGCTFLDCSFEACNLALTKFPGSGLKTVSFEDCKIMGVRFDEADDFLFAVSFTHSQLDYSWFSRKKMPKTTFLSGSLKGVNFEGSDLTQAVFDDLSLAEAVFDQTNLTAADFSTARDYEFDPERNTIAKARFSASGLPGLLSKYKLKIV